MKTAMTMIDFENDAIHVLDKILVYRYFKWSLFHTKLMHIQAIENINEERQSVRPLTQDQNVAS